MSADERVEAVVTGSPEVRLLACVACGVLLWDIDAHYEHAHQDRTIRRFCTATRDDECAEHGGQHAWTRYAALPEGHPDRTNRSEGTR